MGSQEPPDSDRHFPEWKVDNVRTGDDALLRVRQLGFSDPGVIREAIQDGAGAYRAADTPLHPAAYPGERMWGETFASLVNYAQDAGWERERIVGVELVVNRNTGVAVIVTAGDGGTGRENVGPNVRYRREQVISGLVNGSFDSLFDVGERPEWEVWFLLHSVSGDRIVPAELSRPRLIDAKGFVPSWIERLIVPDSVVGGDGDRMPVETSPASDSPASPVVNVQRRAANQ